jgi:hypothetical protein
MTSCVLLLASMCSRRLSAATVSGGAGRAASGVPGAAGWMALALASSSSTLHQLTWPQQQQQQQQVVAKHSRYNRKIQLEKRRYTASATTSRHANVSRATTTWHLPYPPKCCSLGINK